MKRSPAAVAPPYTVKQLAKRALLHERSIRRYVQDGTLPPVRFRGPDVKYSQEHLLRLLLIKKLQSTNGASAMAACATVRQMTLSQVEAAMPEEMPATQAQAVATGDARERWWRIVLGKGLELHVREGDYEAERAAIEIRAKMGK